jgi:hypothetical protein
MKVARHGINIRRGVKVVFPLLLFVVAFVPRIDYLVARSTIWHVRAGRFIEAVLSGDWESTLLAPHPGVTTMWLAGIANLAGRQIIPDFGGLPLDQRMTVELFPLALVISLAIVLTYFLLARIFGRLPAAVVTLLLALDPFHISISKTLHVDAIMGVFLMISALLILVYIGPTGHGHKRYIVASGIFAGLALLSKTPALFLIPFFLLCLAAWKLGEVVEIEGGAKLSFAEKGVWLESTKELAGLVVLWTVFLAVTFFALWPSMWVQPAVTLANSFSETLRFSATPHPRPVFFLGQITMDDPGPLFYPVMLLIKTTIVTLPFFLIGVAFLFSRKLEGHKRLALSLLVAVVLFFTLQMTLGDKKFARYLLPAFEFVVIVAGLGAFYLIHRLAGGRKRILYLGLFVVLAVQFAISIPRHPYYGTHYNRLLGGANRILESGIVPGQEQGEAMDLAAAYLNNLPLAQLTEVGSQIEESFGRYYLGKTVRMADENVEYLVFGRNWVVRNFEASNGLWEKYKSRPPKHVVYFDQVPYAWIYKVGPAGSEESPQQSVNALVGENIRLVGFDLEPATLRPGDTLNLTMYWEALQKPEGDYTVFIHLLAPSGELYGQWDSQPQAGKYPTFLWDEGERVQDQVTITVAPDAPPGSYVIATGMYTLDTLARLPVTTKDGDAAPDSRILLPGPQVTTSAD